jgi:hypothetical protein
MHTYFADILLNGAAAFAVGLIIYLAWLSFEQKRRQRKAQKQRAGQRRGHWGYQ